MPLSTRCVAAEGLGRWLASDSRVLGDQRKDCVLALGFVLKEVETKCDDLRCAAALALARACTCCLDMGYGMERVRENLEWASRNDSCRYVRAYAQEALRRENESGDLLLSMPIPERCPLTTSQSRW